MKYDFARGIIKNRLPDWSNKETLCDRNNKESFAGLEN